MLQFKLKIITILSCRVLKNSYQHFHQLDPYISKLNTCWGITLQLRVGITFIPRLFNLSFKALLIEASCRIGYWEVFTLVSYPSSCEQPLILCYCSQFTEMVNWVWSEMLTWDSYYLSYLSKDRVSPKGSRPAQGCFPGCKTKQPATVIQTSPQQPMF